MKKSQILLPPSYNYVGVFLTFRCTLGCSYCINRHRGAKPKSREMTGAEWIESLNRLSLSDDLPITLQGGEPSLHKGFYDIINGIDKSKHIDILTNLRFDVKEFAKRVKPERLRRDSPYASIRVSFHPETMELVDTVKRVKYLQNRGYHIGVWIIDHPRDSEWVRYARGAFLECGIDCRLKEFLGEYKGIMYGTYKYPEAVDGIKKSCLCKPSEMLVAPDGSIHNCHYFLYNNYKGVANIKDEKVDLVDDFTPCSVYGMCNECDVKLKTDRFQKSGYCSVEIKG